MPLANLALPLRKDEPLERQNRPEIPILLLEPALVLPQEALKIMEQNPAEDRALRMARAIDSRHIGNADSKNVPEAVRGRSGGRENEPSTHGSTHLPRY
jgi:hypothetical protein